MVKSRWTGHVARIGEKRNAYGLTVGKPERKGQLERPRRRCVDNIKMDLGEIGWVVLTGLVWLRIEKVENSCECGRKPQNAGRFSNGCTTYGLSSSAQLHRFS
jgi:hypothetical protein